MTDPLMSRETHTDEIVPPRHVSPPSWRDVLPIAILGTLLSLFFTGFRFGDNNNIYHIPYVLGWARLPAFADDQFYQTLTYFTSAVWPPIRLIATESNIYAVFLAAFIVSRLAAFIGIAFLIAELGLRERRYLLLGVLAAAATPWLQGVSALGEHGLLIDYFTHSEFTWPFVIGAMLCTLRRNLPWVAVFAAITLSINAFVGIWLLLTIPVCILLQPPLPRLRTLLQACLIFAVLALPISIWVLSALLSPHEVYAFRFSDYIRAFYPYHFLIDTVAHPSINAFVCMAGAGLLSTWLVPHGRFWRTALLAELALLAVGTVLPYVLDHKIVFDMHFLRLGGVIQFFSILLAIAACLNRMARSENRADWIVPGLMLAALIFNEQYRITLLLVMLAACHPLARLLKHRAARTLGGAASGLGKLKAQGDYYELCLAALALLAWMALYVLTSRQLSAVAYFMVIAIAAAFLPGYRRQDKRHTILTTFVLALLVLAAGEHAVAQRALNARNAASYAQGPLPMAQWLRAHPIQGKLLLSPEAMTVENFQVLAKTSVWADFKQGAAVLWYPYFYKQWSERYGAVMQLTTLPALASYAREHHIPYLVGRDAAKGCPANTTLLHTEGNFVLCGVAP